LPRARRSHVPRFGVAKWLKVRPLSSKEAEKKAERQYKSVAKLWSYLPKKRLKNGPIFLKVVFSIYCNFNQIFFFLVVDFLTSGLRVVF
jgi:hypothetical protein